ncbi:helix-turn-helix transcriptional regulator [Enterococcus faecalis]|uniref:helix-turn-helix domain-containing protein n=1 Tax=Enterococcus faecalis TaxID=1351 RepID=UPI00177D99BF|nr:helix-turn-helix transcriptional regulator [Enterococcus faecalis]EJG4482900.1 helix-turn-helix transcriptional regulator [Enterococcus faecalis]EKL7559153.1 helix-turn-helix transcriptional regulator [Enterococcus faecalis]MBD9844010.1 helix-turn-helix transcriptional regulator [Enterococcus faecalis]MDR9788681.1 helix-turn-helix transcriptional regulator [Enterococcus faecalis]HBI1614263.1 helix-turn-helix transcriptional regulator [Enterococcus faecalis]
MFNERIKKRRNELQWTQQDVADKLFVTRQTISNWENGKSFPDMPMLIKISDLFSLSIDYLLKGDEDYMKKIEQDYKQIGGKRQIKKLSRIVATLTIIIMLIAIVGGIILDKSNEKWIGLSILTLCIPLEIFSYFLYKIIYSQSESSFQSVWVPKLYGVGLSINPNTFLGKAVWGIIFIGLISIWCYILIFK